MTQEAPARTKMPTTGPRRDRTARRASQGRPHGTRQDPRGRHRTRSPAAAVQGSTWSMDAQGGPSSRVVPRLMWFFPNTQQSLNLTA